MSKWRVALLISAAVFLMQLPMFAGSIAFTTFVSNSQLNTALGNTQVIGYTYAGNKFVGSLYPSDNRLYSTDLSGGNVQLFGSVPGGSGEVVVGASLGKGGFAVGDIYAGSGSNTQIYHFSNSGGASNLFTTLPTGGSIRSIFFDPGSSFHGNMLVTTTSGDIYSVDSSGTPSLLASLGVDTEGMDIVGSTFGKYAGSLLAASEGNGHLNLIDPITHAVTFIGTVSGSETVAYVPQNLGSGDPSKEGFYAANFAVDIVKADPSQFTQSFSQLGGRNLLGDAIVTDEFGHGIYDIHWNGSSFDPPTLIGSYPNQPEDGIFVTAQRIHDVVPEPGSVMMMAAGLVALAGAFRRKRNR